MKQIISVLAVSSIFIFSEKSFAQSEADGTKAMIAENFNSAKNIYRAILQADQKEPKNYFNLGEALYANEQFDSAKTMYDAGLALNPRSLPNMIGVGKCLLNAGKKDDAIKNFNKALDIASSKDILTAVLVAQAYIGSEKNGMPDAAIDLLTKKKEVNDKSAALYEALGDAYIYKNDGGNAVTNYESAVSNDPNRVAALVKIGEIYVRAKNYDEAIKDFNNALAIEPNFPPAHRELSDLYFMAGKFDKAKTEFDEYLKFADQTIETKIRNAKILYKNERYDDAIKSINEVLQTQPNNYIMYRLLAYSYTKQEKMNDAETQFQQYFQKVPAAEIIPTDYSNYAKALSKNGKDSLAILTMKKAMETDKTVDFNNDILGIYFKQKKYSTYTDAYESLTAKGFTPNVTSYFYAARSYYYQSKWKLADSANAMVTQLVPTNPSGWLGRAQCNTHIDSTSTLGLAKPFYEKYLTVIKIDDPKNKNGLMESYRYLGAYAYLQEKDNEKAKDFFNKILALDPDDKQAQDVLKGLNGKK